MNKDKQKNVALINTFANIIHQIISIICGFIIPQIIINYFGSSVNGLVSSLSQFLSYIALIEGGITGVLKAKLYKPLYEKNQEKISSIVKTANSFYHKIAYIFIIYSIILSLIYPVIFKTDFSYIYIFSLSIILSINLLIQYMFSLTYKTLLISDNKGYIVAITQSFILFFNIVIAYLSTKIYPNIHILKFITALMYLLQPIIYTKFVNKYYNINKKSKIDKSLLKSRWNGFAINIASFIHNSTDIVVLTIFSSLEDVSIYSVYALIASGLKIIISSIISALTPIIGKTYASKNINELNKKFKVFQYIVIYLSFLFYSIAILLITPFVMIYTKGIVDANYYQPLFGVLILLSEFLYLIVSPHLELAYCADKFKEITMPSYIETMINIILSVILVKKYGLIGVAIGTCFAMLYRVLFQINFTEKNILNRIKKDYYKTIFIFTIFCVLGITICQKFLGNIQYNIFSWISYAFVYTVILIIFTLLASLISNKDELRYIKDYIKNILNKNNSRV